MKILAFLNVFKKLKAGKETEGEEVVALQLGIPLDNDTLAKMSKEQRKFWNAFLTEAMKCIKEKTAKGETQPFTPPLSLQERYRDAVVLYGGGVYCQVKQLKRIFNFFEPPVQKQASA